MTDRYPYDEGFSPPAPVLPLRVGPPEGEMAMLIPAMVDSGADITVVPAAVARGLGLPQIGMVHVRGAAGEMSRAAIHAARIETADVAQIAEVLALGEQALLGRDVLLSVVAVLHGPGRYLEVR